MFRSVEESVRSRCSRDVGKRGREVMQQGVAQAKVRFGIFKVDRIDLMRHGRGAHLMTVGSLPEVPQGDVGPHITGKVNRDGVEAQQDVKQLCHVVVRFDLCGQRIPGEPQTLDKVTRNLLPGRLGVRDGVGVVATHGAIALAQIGRVCQVLQLPLPAIHEDR